LLVIRKLPLDGVTVRLYNSQNLNIASINTNNDGSYSLSVPVGSGYYVKFMKTGYITACYSNITINENITTYLETVLQIDQSHSGSGIVNGLIIDALNGQGVSGATINLRTRINVTTGNIVASTTTSSSGTFSIANLQANQYTAEVSKSGYMTAYFTVVCIGGVTNNNQNYTLTPNLNPNEFRIILTWGASPSDLDSHLTGPKTTGDTSSNSWEETGRFHIYYYHRTYNYNSIKYADLDRDDRSSYGPETITIYQENIGLYRYSVHDYSNRYSSNSYALSNSSAQVKVYKGSNLLAIYNVPANQGGTLWTVFELNGDTITPINTLTYSSNPVTVKSINTNYSNTDVKLLQNLPEKR
jgi:hypothetical protein